MKFSIEQINNNVSLIDGLKNGGLSFDDPAYCNYKFFQNDYGCVVKNLCDSHASYLKWIALFGLTSIVLFNVVVKVLFVLHDLKKIQLSDTAIKFLYFKDFYAFAVGVVGFGLLYWLL